MPSLDRIESLFHGASALPPESDRVVWLAAECQGDSALFEEVSGLLDARAEIEVRARTAGTAKAADAPLPSALFGAYQAVRLLGRGGMSTVYVAERADGHYRQQVALKVMAGHLADGEFFRRFEAERQFLAALNHPNITRLLDGGISPGGPFLVTEYVDGESIDRYCEEKKLNIEQRLRLFVKVCEAVEHAHRNLIVHRDLKPANILVNREGEVKLLDFGTASLTENSQNNPTLTRIRMLTPRYASPEQLRGERVNIATDVFSLGVVLCELLTGAWPFGDPNSLLCELDRATGSTSARPPETTVSREAAQSRSASQDQLSRALKGDLSAITLRALEPAPAQRYQSVRAFAADLENFLNGQPVAARKQSVAYRAGKFLRRRWLPVTAAAVFVLGLAGVSLIAVHQAQVARAEALKARDEARRSARITDFLRRMLISGTRTGGRDVTVAQLLMAAEPGMEIRWKDDPLGEATLRSSLGTAYVTLKQRERGRLQLEKTVTLYQSLGRHVDAADALISLGVNATSGTDAAGYYRRSLDELKLAGAGVPRPLLFRTTVYLAGVLKDRREIAEARTLVDAAIAMGEAGVPSDLRSAAVQIRGETLLEDGRFDEADAALRQAIALDRHATDAWRELARLSSLRQDFRQAASWTRQGYEQVAGFDTEDKAELAIWWARYRADAGEEADALRSVGEFLPAVRQYYQRGFVTSLYLQAAAHVFNRAGRFTEAEQKAREALAILHENQGPELHPVFASSLEELGAALCGLKRYREAVPALEKSVDIYRRLGPAYATAADRVQVLTRTVTANHSNR